MAPPSQYRSLGTSTESVKFLYRYAGINCSSIHFGHRTPHSESTLFNSVSPRSTHSLVTTTNLGCYNIFVRSMLKLSGCSKELSLWGICFATSNLLDREDMRHLSAARHQLVALWFKAFNESTFSARIERIQQSRAIQFQGTQLGYQ